MMDAFISLIVTNNRHIGCALSQRLSADQHYSLWATFEAKVFSYYQRQKAF